MKFARMQQTIESKEFLSKKGIINEVPFFIFAYQPTEETAVQKQTFHLVKSLRTKGVGILEINLYDLCVDLIKERNLWDKLLEMEKGWDKHKFSNQLKNLIDVSEKIIPEISKRIEEFDNLQVLLLSGVGQIYPFIVHTPYLIIYSVLLKITPPYSSFPVNIPSPRDGANHSTSLVS